MQGPLSQGRRVLWHPALCGWYSAGGASGAWGEGPETSVATTPEDAPPLILPPWRPLSAQVCLTWGVSLQLWTVTPAV